MRTSVLAAAAVLSLSACGDDGRAASDAAPPLPDALPGDCTTFSHEYDVQMHRLVGGSDVKRLAGTADSLYGSADSIYRLEGSEFVSVGTTNGDEDNDVGSELTALGSAVYFAADSPERSGLDGTMFRFSPEAGLEEVTAITEATEGEPHDLNSYGGDLFFSADTLEGRAALLRYDPEADTVTELAQTSDIFGVRVFAWGNRIVAAITRSGGGALVLYDPTDDQTQTVDLTTAAGSELAARSLFFTALESELLFVAAESLVPGEPHFLYRYDGTSIRKVPLPDDTPLGADLLGFVTGDTVYFVAMNAAGDAGLYRYRAGTNIVDLVRAVHPDGPAPFTDLDPLSARVGEQVFMRLVDDEGPGIFILDEADGSISRLSSVCFSVAGAYTSLGRPAPEGDRLLFDAHSPSGAVSLFAYDPPSGGFTQLAERTSPITPFIRWGRRVAWSRGTVERTQ